MKKLLIYILAASASMIAYADNWMRDAEPGILEVHYTRTQVTDTTKRATNYFKEETMLRIGRGMSLYCSVPRFYRDSLRFNNPGLYFQMEAASFEKDPREHDRTSLERSGRYDSFIYKNYPEGKVTETAYFEMEDWRYDEDWEKPEWDISDESKEIIGYQCFKATTDYRGRRWTAWFTPEIPIQDGPWKLCGLPGLISRRQSQRVSVCCQWTETKWRCRSRLPMLPREAWCKQCHSRQIFQQLVEICQFQLRCQNGVNVRQGLTALGS